MPRMTGNRYFAEAVHAVRHHPRLLRPHHHAPGHGRDGGHGHSPRGDPRREGRGLHGRRLRAGVARDPGICLAQTIGSANLAAGLRDAYLACSPVIALTGGVDAASALQARLPGDRRLPHVGAGHQGELPRGRPRAIPGPAAAGLPRRDQRGAGPGASRDGGHPRAGPRARGRARRRSGRSAS